ncbi:MAG TPA: LamG domain-containing protein, partial [Propionibacteriaceae bacterium]|nr:LamG domain-containing protein [Propionibacteriaceae bacterium]
TAPTVSRGSTDDTAVVRWPTNWDRDERTLTYEVLRDGVVIHTVRAASVFWKRPVLQATDGGLSLNTNYSYRVRVSDPAGNTVTSAATVFRNPPANQYPATIDADGADHQWRFNSPAGTTSEPDQAGPANLSLANDVTLGGAGASTLNTQTAATVAGTSLTGSSTAVPETQSGQGSIEFWFKTAKTGGTLVAFGAGDGVNTTANVRARELYLNGAGQLSFAVRRPDDTVKPFIAETAGSLADNQWHHVAAVQTNTALFLYIDGLEQAAAPATPLVSSTGRWWVGGRTPVKLPEELTTGFKGQIDELSTFPTALTAAQVHRHYQLGVQQPAWT